MIWLAKNWRIVAALGLLAAAFGAGVWVRDAFCRAKVAQMQADTAEATTAALRAERVRIAHAIAEANDKARQLAEAESALLTARDARAAAERRLFDALEDDPGLDAPGLPGGVLDQIRGHWAQ
ncbi:hypothetical protein [Thioclava sp. F36-6]|uniref:hypothetical protein n=1 Tax=Thioclava sp. F36-6 TaxID=1915316 RepID=UPI000997D74B|nr:hypothetical protein [Thioclava sp. F36-6]